MLLDVKAEKFVSFPIFNPKAGGWVKGAALERAPRNTTMNCLIRRA